MRTRIVSDTERSAAQRIIDRLHVEAQHEGTVPSRFLDLMARVLRDKVWEEREQTFLEFIEADYPNGVGLPKSELRNILKLKHKHEDKKLEKAEEMDWVRAEIERYLNEAEPALPVPAPPPEPGPGRGHKKDKAGNVVTRFNRGNSETYALRRLKRDRPDLAERVVNKELSANAAAIEAGFRDRTFTVSEDVHKAARTLRKHFDPDELYQAMKGATR